MSELFYIAANGEQTGPFLFDELKSKGVQRDTLVWTQGFDSWTKAGDIPLLKEILEATPPPIPQMENISYSDPQNALPLPYPSNITYRKNYFGYDLASRGDRFIATILEWLILIIPLIIIHIIVIGWDGRHSFWNVILNIPLYAILGAMFYPMWIGNLGHKLMGLKVISSVDGSDMKKPSDGALRELTKSAFGIFIIPSIWLLWDSDKQNLYDKVVNSYVVKK